MKRLTIDSSVFISALNIEDKSHQSSREFFAVLNDRKIEIIIPATIILEVYNVLVRLGKKKGALEVVENLLDFNVIEIDLDFITNILPRFDEFDLKTADVIVASIAAYYNSTLITWDRKLLKAVKRTHSAVTPADFIK